MFGITGKKRKRIIQLEGAVRELSGTVTDILTGLQVGTSTTGGNQYTDRREAVGEIRSKFKNEATWGSIFVQRIVGVRKSMVMPYGVDTHFIENADKVSTEKERDEAMEVVNKFLEFNDFNEGMATDLAQEGEIEANVLLDLRLWDEKEKAVKVRYKSWYDLNYSAVKNTQDPGVIDRITWKDGSGKDHSIEGTEIVFTYFNGLLNTYEGVPTLAPMLTILENLHKTLNNWHRFNELYGKVTPVFEVLTEEEADKINAQLVSKGWKLGNAIAMAGKFNFVAPNSEGATSSLDKEIRTSVQIVSGHTGVGPHILGFPDVMSNRAAGDSMGEPTEVVAIAEISKWSDFYEDMFDKIIKKHNAEMNKEVKTGLVKPKLLPMTDRQWTRAMKFWYPAARDGLVSIPLFLANIPDVNVEEELKRQNDQAVERLLQVQPGASGTSDREDQGLPNSAGRQNSGNSGS